MIKVATMLRPSCLLVLPALALQAQVPGNPAPATSAPAPKSDPAPRQSILISGKVVLSDGTPPTEAIKIEVVNRTSIRTECHVDSKGEFSFLLGPSKASFNDAGNVPRALEGSMVRVGRSERELMVNMANLAAVGGQSVSEEDLLHSEVRASLPGYRSDSISLAHRRLWDEPNIGTIVLRRVSDIKGFATSATTAGAPKEAAQALEKGLELAKKQQLDASRAEFERAVKAYPSFAVAWNELGKCFQGQQKFEEAKAAFQKSIDADSLFLTPYEGMSQLAARENRWKDVLELTNKVLQLNPYDFPVAYYFNAVANLNFQNLAPAEQSIRQSIRMDPGNTSPRRRYVLALILAQKQDFRTAISILKSYLKDLEKSASSGSNPAASREAETVRKKLAAIEKEASEMRTK